MPQLRKLTINDASSCGKIMDELKTHYDHPIGGHWTAENFRQELKDQSGWGIFDDDDLMQAFCLFRELDEKTIEIMLLATAYRQHRSGAMRAMIRSLITDIRPQTKIWIEVHAGNLPAIGLYESLGFRLQGERPNYYGDGGKALLFEYKPLQ